MCNSHRFSPNEGKPMMIKGIYKVPAIKHAFFIISSPDKISEEIGLEEVEKRNKHLEHILLSKNYICPTEIESWTFEVLFEKNFLRVLSTCMSRVGISSKISSHNPACLELLAINLVKTNKEPSDLKTPRMLGVADDEDVIEVFI